MIRKQKLRLPAPTTTSKRWPYRNVRPTPSHHFHTHIRTFTTPYAYIGVRAGRIIDSGITGAIIGFTPHRLGGGNPFLWSNRRTCIQTAFLGLVGNMQKKRLGVHSPCVPSRYLSNVSQRMGSPAWAPSLAGPKSI
ncbi:hypothetical protein CI238_07213 [Colletotrichum incanum]|uniref:Uncharacterized protein n=1 Tax=Colletotrichum incanum TaxID=1573173 RepID=A0A167E124_COLIC|nr:hypothetical protein CI238_07213 [Colletotrichum incanum]